MAPVRPDFTSLPLELVKEIFVHLLTEDEGYWRARANASDLMRARWKGVASSFNRHPDRRYGLTDQEKETYPDARRQMCLFGTTCKSWRGIVTAFRAQLLSVDVQSGRVSFDPLQDITHDASSVRHLELAVVGTPCQRSPLGMPLLQSLLSLMAVGLNFLSLDPHSILWLDGILHQLPGTHGQLRGLRLFGHKDEGTSVRETLSLPPAVYDTVALCHNLEEAVFKRASWLHDADSHLPVLVSLPKLERLASFARRPAGAQLLGAVTVQSRFIRRLYLKTSAVTLLTAIAIADQCATTLQYLSITGGGSADASATITRARPSYPKLEYVKLRSTNESSIAAAVSETEAMLNLLEEAPVLIHISLDGFWFYPREAAEESQTPVVEAPTQRLITKVGNGVVEKLQFVPWKDEDEEEGQGMPEELLAALLNEDERPSSWKENGVEVFYDAD